ncbi:MAG TPA: VOC family protein [Solirubrobacteraceae bacterium]|nr:VOC family protein [Solirubrobacteraceae bacterium]
MSGRAAGGDDARDRASGGGIRHVALETARAEAPALVAFLALLGFREVAAPAGLEEIALWLERDGAQVHVLFEESPVAPPRGHLAVACGEDYEATLGRLRDAGFEPRPRREYWGSPRAYVRGPGGHLVEVMAFPPAPAAGA